MTNAVFDKSFEVLMRVEGGYVDDPNDKGGKTKYGISQKSYPNIDIAILTKEEAKQIYYDDYWNRCKCRFLPDCLSLAVFDFAVNSGNKTAIKKLQSCLGVKVDGVIGNQTIGACNRLPLKKLLDDYFNERVDYLISLKDFKHFGKGWINRVNIVRKECEDLL